MWRCPISPCISVGQSLVPSRDDQSQIGSRRPGPAQDRPLQRGDGRGAVVLSTLNSLLIVGIDSMQTVSTERVAPFARPVSGRRGTDWRRLLTIGAFLLPAAAVYSLFVLFPLVQAGYYGLYKWNGLGPLEDYVGLDNFRRVLDDDVFRKAIRNNLLILAMSLVIQ